MSLHLLTAQKIISTRNFQSQFAKMLKNAEKHGFYYNIVRNGESIGVFLPIHFWESLLEDMEALSSTRYLAGIAKARKEIARGEVISFEEAFKE
ncbi:type II toxin-antitoxin system Phd/YefM family antitoxin [Patescibacteria group bacterium]|nr:type II toxin-antitoxin system Phd/YefM family antitoxin [Patescibacteria group bacterium]MBU1016171.1 type II toxin-antitoxin system Phd/YefM family antitoxin [Patescibacteria group bacterium]MBU1684719.1 type II toxin-antitoxin system Phd/YefM family antitoxin [Patescibacteria group bacterium]MBU1938904.1 type II toxin-antitoxin system Phd/YefM family antitoxin [Patescibacteria group bacterium]